MRIAYARVSTDQQELYRQMDILDKVGYDRLIKEKYTGTKKDRAGLNQLMSTVREGDTIIVESISRLGRNTLDILNIVEEIDKLGAKFISLKENLDTSTPTGKAMFNMMAVIAQLERDLIAQRTREGLESAKSRGVRLGRPELSPQKVQDALRLYDNGNHSIKDICRIVGISQGKLYKEINKRKLQESISN